MNRLDKEMTARKIVSSRSQAENYIKLGVVSVDGKVIKKPSFFVRSDAKIELAGDKYVSRAALKLASISDSFGLDFKDKVVLDVGSSTGGFTDYALQHGAKKVIAVDVGTDQLHPSLQGDKRIELHEKTNIRSVRLQNEEWGKKNGDKQQNSPPIVFLDTAPDITVIDVSFVSLRNVLPSISNLQSPISTIVAMCKPQFEAGKEQINKGIIKNSSIRRHILKDFEAWLKDNNFIILDKADSQVAGTKGNVERFYKLRTVDSRQ